MTPVPVVAGRRSMFLYPVTFNEAERVAIATVAVTPSALATKLVPQSVNFAAHPLAVTLPYVSVLK